MRASLHAVFNVVLGNVYFALVIFNIHGRKRRFSEISQNNKLSIVSSAVDFFWLFVD